MSDTWGYDDETPPPPAVMRGLSSGHIPLARVAASRAAQQSVLQSPLPAQPKLDMTPQPGIADMFSKFASSITDETEKAQKYKELNDILTALKQKPVDIPQIAAAQARMLDPTQAPEGSEAQIDPSGVPQGYFAKNRSFESGNSRTAVNKDTGAAGLYQFLPSTAEGIRKANPQLNISDNWRTNEADQEKLMQAYTQQSAGILKKQLGRDPTGGELYALHLLGHGGGSNLLANLDKPVSELTSAEARRLNPVLNKYKTARELVNYFNGRF